MQVRDNDDSQMLTNAEKQFAFLGIFSGETGLTEHTVELEGLTITQKIGSNVGVVWYANLVEEIIEHGIEIPKP